MELVNESGYRTKKSAPKSWGLWITVQIILLINISIFFNHIPPQQSPPWLGKQHIMIFLSKHKYIKIEKLLK